MNWEESLHEAVKTCIVRWESKNIPDGITAMVESARWRQLVHEEDYLEGSDEPKWAAVRLIGYYNLLAAFDAAARGNLNGHEWPVFICRARRAANHSNSVSIMGLIDEAVDVLLPPSPTKPLDVWRQRVAYKEWVLSPWRDENGKITHLYFEYKSQAYREKPSFCGGVSEKPKIFPAHNANMKILVEDLKDLMGWRP